MQLISKKQGYITYLSKDNPNFFCCCGVWKGIEFSWRWIDVTWIWIPFDWSLFSFLGRHSQGNHCLDSEIIKFNHIKYTFQLVFGTLGVALNTHKEGFWIGNASNITFYFIINWDMFYIFFILFLTIHIHKQYLYDHFPSSWSIQVLDLTYFVGINFIEFIKFLFFDMEFL